MKGIIVDKSKATIEEPMLSKYPKNYFSEEVEKYYKEQEVTAVITTNDLEEAIEKAVTQINERMPCGIQLTADIHKIPGHLFMYITEKPKSLYKHWIRAVCIWILERTK